MAEHELELRLRAVAGELDAQVPTFDISLLGGAPRRRIGGKAFAVVCVVALVGVASAPAAVSALRHLFDVDEVEVLGPLAPGVAPPFAGRSVPASSVQAVVPFRVRLMSALGAPDDVRVRDDIAGGLVTIAYEGGRIRLAQWRSSGIHARITLVPAGGLAEDVEVRGLPAVWIQGTARGTFSLTGADGATHHESFAVGTGVLLWKDRGLTLMLSGAASTAQAMSLAEAIDH